MSYKSDISVIIVNYNTSGHLSECLKSFRKYFPENEIEIIVSDNNSTDGKLPELVNKFPEVKFFQRDVNDGFPGGCNYGAERSGCNYLLFVNPDIILKDNSLIKLKEILEIDPSAGIVSGVMTDENDQPIYFYNDFPAIKWEIINILGFGYEREIQRLVNRREIRENQNFEVDWFHGAFLMMRRSDFKLTGGFNEKYFMYYEDVEMCYYFKNNFSKRNICITGIKYYHHTQASIDKDKNDDIYIFHINRGKLLFIQNYKFPERTLIYIAGLTYVITRLIALPFWNKYKGRKKDKLTQLLKVLKLYLNINFLNTSKYEYIKK